MSNYVSQQIRIPDTEREIARMVRALADVGGQIAKLERIVSDSLWGVVWIPEDCLEEWGEKMKRPAPKPRSQQKRRPSCSNFRPE